MDQKRAIFDLRFGKPEISEAELLEKSEILQKWGLYGFKFPLAPVQAKKSKRIAE
jgi:hypothetical protein